MYTLQLFHFYSPVLQHDITDVYYCKNLIAEKAEAIISDRFHKVLLQPDQVTCKYNRFLNHNNYQNIINVKA